MLNMFKVNNKDTRKTPLAMSSAQQKVIHTCTNLQFVAADLFK